MIRIDKSWWMTTIKNKIWVKGQPEKDGLQQEIEGIKPPKRIGHKFYRYILLISLLENV